MSETDTSAAAVQRLLERLTWHVELSRKTDRPCSADCFSAARQMIAALAAERDEAIDQRNAADVVLALSIEQSNRHSVERDAARAEVARLTAAVAAARHEGVEAAARAMLYSRRHLGPCLTLAEVEAEKAAARREGIEAALAVLRQWPNATDERRAIRALLKESEG